MQRKILDQILNRIPPHPAAHGFRRHRSCLSYVQPHINQEAVLRMDLANFFQTIEAGRVRGIFRALGYPAGITNALTRLCTHQTAEQWLQQSTDLDFHYRQRLRCPHLPQGAPTSPALANLVAFRLDCRLTGLANKFGLQYSRYADDIALSGNRYLARHYQKLEALVGAIVIEEGFSLNFRKTRLMTAGQQQRLTGLVINKKPNIDRREYNRLKATLYNCVRYGPKDQNREQAPNFQSHLAGRIEQIAHINPERGRKLKKLYEQISWTSP